MASLKGVVNC